MKRWLVIGLMMMLTGVCVAEEWTVKSLTQAIQAAKDDAAVEKICRETIESSNDPVAVDRAFYIWAQRNDAHFKAFIGDPSRDDSARFLYLRSQVAENVREKLRLARLARKAEPESPYGFYAVGSVYSRYLFDGHRRSGTADSGYLENELHADESIFRNPPEKFKEDPVMLRYRVGFEIFRGNYLQALGLLEQAKKQNAQWVSPAEFARVYVLVGDLDNGAIKAAEYADALVKSGQLEPAGKDGYAFAFLQSLLIDAKKYDEALDRYLARPESTTDNGDLYNIACIYALKGDSDHAFEYLDKAVAAGWDDSEQMKADSDLASLRKDSRWPKALAAADAAWKRGRADRRKKILAGKMRKPAPPWELKDSEGRTVKLTDYKGKIVILDFWATWCGPCKMAMPKLDAWCRKEKPKNVEVISVNVWERDGKKAKKMFQAKKYAMHLVFGTDAVAKQYGIQGIPYICAVGPEGNIRFEQLGYDRSLGEILNTWVAELGK